MMHGQRNIKLGYIILINYTIKSQGLKYNELRILSSVLVFIFEKQQ